VLMRNSFSIILKRSGPKKSHRYIDIMNIINTSLKFKTVQNKRS